MPKFMCETQVRLIRNIEMRIEMKITLNMFGINKKNKIEGDFTKLSLIKS